MENSDDEGYPNVARASMRRLAKNYMMHCAHCTKSAPPNQEIYYRVSCREYLCEQCATAARAALEKK